MKRCSYCGRENNEDAACCYECGTEFQRPSEPVPVEPKRPEYEFAPISEADRENDFVTLVKCGSLIAADIVAGRLRAAGIEALIPDEHLMQAIGFNLNTFGYVRVQVPPKDYEAARDLLSAIDRGA
jgi:hypothetical protein